jgi:hypothetical protein
MPKPGSSSIEALPEGVFRRSSVASSVTRAGPADPLRYGSANEHNAPVPRCSWLEECEKAASVAFHDRYPAIGYVTPTDKDKRAGREKVIWAERTRKLAAAAAWRGSARALVTATAAPRA